MDLVQAICLAGKCPVTPLRADLFRLYYKKFLSALRTLLPNATLRPNDHMAFHIYDGLLSFGPMRSWWTFPFERLNGKLQDLPHNQKIGQLSPSLCWSELTSIKANGSPHSCIVS
jgi:hypothetical protein